MASEWRATPLAEVADLFDGPHQTAPLASNGPVVYLNVGDIRSGRIELRMSGRVSEEVAEKWSRRVVPWAGDTVFGYEATIGDAAMLPSTHRWCLGRRVGLLRPRRERVDPRFLAYSWYSPAFQETIRLNTVRGSTIESIRLTDLPLWTVSLPPLPEQRKIAHVLGTLDDKIELNRRTAATLDAMARALFKSWFVDFDPVRAKAAGRAPCLPRSLADLFPGRLASTELGEVPAGWCVDPMGGHVDAVKGLSYKGAGLGESGRPLHNLNSVHEGGGYKFEGMKYYAGEFADRHCVRAGDVIVANTEQGHDRLLIGYAAVVPALFGDGGLFSHHLYRLRPRSASPLTAAYIAHLLNCRPMHDVVSGYANGTTVNMLALAGVQQPLVVMPPRPLVEAFDRIAVLALQRQEESVAESRTLVALRDALLPKLLSGDLRIPAAARRLTLAGAASAEPAPERVQGCPS